MDIVLRATVIFAVVFLLTRVVGKRELASLEPFDVILLVVIGDLVQQGVTQSDYSLTGAVLAILTISMLTVATAYVAFRFRALRPVLEGEPVVLIERGRVLEGNLKRERITHEELNAEARQQQIGSLADVEWAVLETTGRISFLQRPSG
ncbi:MAG TPA: YetF domain-containing protein [Solirubrobacteraceae bacterium]|jgi:uncharacterized membrane protein YcaP (DUF421 family)|nr:YetF domain-containing protein [Solirubrobacteraceae bacterium]